MKISPNTKYLLDCLIDRHVYPYFEGDKEDIEIFQRWQTTGKITSDEKSRIYPLVWAQTLKESRLKSIAQECEEFRRAGFGWIWPLLSELIIETPTKNHGVMYWAIRNLTNSIAKKYGYIVEWRSNYEPFPKLNPKLITYC
jgi:hypothetical protein